MQFTLESRHLILIYGMPQLKAPRLRTIIDHDLP
jgi:hypothetical protein